MSDLQNKLAAGVRAVREDQDKPKTEQPKATTAPAKPVPASKPQGNAATAGKPAAKPASKPATTKKPATDEAPARLILSRRVWPD